ncbi:hypothetical protein BH20CHL6_BH20CHL6_11530 [soil metagenome]
MIQRAVRSFLDVATPAAIGAIAAVLVFFFVPSAISALDVVRAPAPQAPAGLAADIPPLGPDVVPASSQPAASAQPADSAPAATSFSPPATAPPSSIAPRPTATPGSPVAEELEGYVWPLRKGRITSWFGPRDNGFVVIDGVRYHDGLDMTTFCGDWIRSAHDGTVLYAGRRFDPYLGYVNPPDAFYAHLALNDVPLWRLPIAIVIDDGNGYRSLYVHLSESFVKAGDTVTAGQQIGREGATGNASGCHLHYALIRMDGPFQPVAPELVEAALYPGSVRERVDPLRVLSLFHRHAGREVPGVPPPVDYPRPSATPKPSRSPDASAVPSP